MADLPPVKIQLAAEGVDKISQAFATVEQRTKQFAASQEREFAKLAKQAAKWQKQQVADMEKTGKAAEKQAKSSTAAAEKAAKEKEAIQEKQFANLRRQAERWARDEANIEKRKNAQIENDAKRSARARETFFGRMSNRIVSDFRSSMGTIMSLAAGLGALGGGFGVATSLGQTISTQGKAKEISLNTGVSGSRPLSQEEILKAAGRGTSKDVYHDYVKGDPGYSERPGSGFSTEENLGAMSKFLAKTGDSDAMLETLPRLQEMANATGAKLDDLAEAAGFAWNAMTPDEKTKDRIKNNFDIWQKLMSDQIQQARVGALDPAEMGPRMNRLFNSSAQFKGGVTKNAAMMGALTQYSVQKGTSTDAAEASESAKSLSLDIQTHSKALKEAGFTGKFALTEDIGFGNTQLKDLATVFDKLMTVSGGDLGKLEKFGIERRSVRLFEGPQMDYKKGWEDYIKTNKDKPGMSSAALEKGAHQAGLDASLTALKPFVDAQISRDKLRKEADARKEQADKKATDTFDELRNKLGAGLLPVFNKFMEELIKLTPKIVGVTEWLGKLVLYAMNNPIESIFLTLSASMAKAIIAVGLETAAKMILTGTTAGLSTATGAAAISMGQLALTTGKLLVALGMLVAAFVMAKEGLDSIGKTDTRFKTGATAAEKDILAASAGDPAAIARVKAAKENTGFLADAGRINTTAWLTGEKMLGAVTDPLLGTGLKKSAEEGLQAAANQQVLSDQIASYEKAHGSLTDSMDKAAIIQAEANRLAAISAEMLKNNTAALKASQGPKPPATNGKPHGD